MKKAICLIMSFLVALFPFSAAADTDISAASITITSEYISDSMFDDETEDSNEVTVDAASVSVDAKAAVLMDAGTGTVLYDMNSHDRLAPASITKIMSMLLVCEAIEDKKISLEDAVTCSDTAASMGGSQIWLEPGETMTVHELLKATAVGSANDAIACLAEYVSGSIEAFVNSMNERASQLGMTDTNFVNCTGLDAENHYTSAYDIALMSKELISHELILEYTTIWMDYLRDGKTQLVNTNKLVRFYEGTTGLKTGTTDKAGYCLSATAKRGELSLIAVVLSAKDSTERFNGAKRLLNYGFANWSNISLSPDPSELHSVQVKHGVDKNVGVYAEEIPPLLAAKGSEGEYKLSVNLTQEVEAPVEEGQVVGVITVLKGTETVSQVNICAESSVKRVNFLFALGKLLKNLVLF
ncbi:MAG: D-alanyl-D-alanine carboxypeptidase family protein [Acutalibacteraceae bacterium]